MNTNVRRFPRGLRNRDTTIPKDRLGTLSVDLGD